MANRFSFAHHLLLAAAMVSSAIAQAPDAQPPKAVLKIPPKVYEVSTSGRNQKMLLKVFAEVQKTVGEDLTKEEFVRRLKAREHFEIRYPETCRTCNGWKRLLSESARRGKDGKVPCKACRATGVELRPYIVKWRADMNTHKGDRRDPILSALIRELGDNASAFVWFSKAREYHTGDSSNKPNSREIAHNAYEQAVAKANAAWRPDEPASSENNRLHRRIIDAGLEGIAATAPQRKEKEKPAAANTRPVAPTRKAPPPKLDIRQTD